eukprot:TRINITY_DN8127_c0_g1_i1.p1 TRINITY_DN8127_c0_g1~~TRINITY_DN8127_c0_g1_i1.p1  ORF type:complete len:302 (-),score=61.09 TRINITY_DN8127_c0_g1_i1:228-1133(-)
MADGGSAPDKGSNCTNTRSSSCSGSIFQRGFPVESIRGEMVNCEIVEFFDEDVLRRELRWPYRFKIPHMSFNSHSPFWNLEQLLDKAVATDLTLPSDYLSSPFAAALGGVCGSGNSSSAATGQNADEGHGLGRQPSPTPSAHNPTIAQGSLGTALPMKSAEMNLVDQDVTIPKAMFDKLVQRAAEATLKDSQVAAAREELQKAYITLAGLRATKETTPSTASTAASSLVAALPTWPDAISSLSNFGSVGHSSTTTQSLSSSSVSGHASIDRQLPETSEDALGSLRKKCAQLESSLQSQGLA